MMGVRLGGSIRRGGRPGGGHDLRRARPTTVGTFGSRWGYRERAAPVFVAKRVVAQREQPPCDGDLGDLGAASTGDAISEPPKGGVLEVRAGGRLHHRPSEPPRALLGDVASARVVGAGALGGGKPGPRALVLWRGE